MNWDDVRLFSTIAEEGSFRQAAMRLNLGHTTLARRIETLENDLGTRLFNRLTSGLTLTLAGEEMLKTASPMRREFDELQLRLFGQDEKPEGAISLTAPPLFVSHLLIEPLEAFTKAWPKINVTINDSLELLDLAAKEADIALRFTNSPSDQLIGRKVGVYLEAAYATPAYLQAFIASNERVHRWIRPSDTYAFEALFDAPYDSPHAMEVQLTLPDVTSQLRCAERGMGFVMLPCIMADANPLLVRFSNLVHRSDIWMLAHKDSRNNRRMQLFREFLVEVFAANQHRLNGETAQPRLAARPTADAVGER